MLWGGSLAPGFHPNSKYLNHFENHTEKNIHFSESIILLQEYSMARLMKRKAGDLNYLYQSLCLTHAPQTAKHLKVLSAEIGEI